MLKRRAAALLVGVARGDQWLAVKSENGERAGFERFGADTP